MENQYIPYKETGFFSKLIVDYLDKKECLEPFYHRFPSIHNFKAQLKEKTTSFPLKNREVLVTSLHNQYKNVEISEATQSNIDALKLENTFTITTGHQLNLFSGPLYFLYKIISVINLCKKLKEKHPENNFVPIYWMASEDHDFEEIQYFNFKQNKIKWDREAGGAVGRLSTKELDIVFKQFSDALNSGKHADELRTIFKEAYVNHTNLAEASRYLVNTLFKSYGLVIIDGDDKELKSLFKPYALQELKENTSYHYVTQTNLALQKEQYPIQVNPREINLFYIGKGFRERIIKEDGVYKVNNTQLQFADAEDLFKNTDKLEFVSGNALLRPLYQEVILPNICYVGGGGELAYWMQLKTTFKAFKVPFPMLLLRNSALLVSEKQQKKITGLDIRIDDLFLPQDKLIVKKIQEKSNLNYNFEEKRKQLQATFLELQALATKTDASFLGAVKAQETKQLKGLNTLEKRLLRAEKRKMKELVDRITLLHHQLFPNHSLQERQHNFSEYYENYGKELIEVLLKALHPLDFNFSVLCF